MKRKCTLTLIVLVSLGFMVGCEKKHEPTERQDINYSTVQKETAPVITKVVLEANMGNIVIEMMEGNAPMTVKNFLQYVKDGFYDGVIFHRVIPGFMIQSGGFDVNMNQKPVRAPVINEFNLSNVRGTVAMAKLSDNPDSATSQFFINLSNNGANLDHQNGGFTVFGKVVQGMDIVDKIAKVTTTIKGPYNDVPVDPVIIKKAKIVNE